MWCKGGKMRIIVDERVAQLASFDFQLNFTVDECFFHSFFSFWLCSVFNFTLNLSARLFYVKLDYKSKKKVSEFNFFMIFYIIFSILHSPPTTWTWTAATKSHKSRQMNSISLESVERQVLRQFFATALMVLGWLGHIIFKPHNKTADFMTKTEKSSSFHLKRFI